MFERFTRDARSVVLRARRESGALHDPRTGTEHLLLALLEGEGVAATVLWQAGLDARTVHEEIGRLRGDFLGDADAAALRSIGIDLDAVRSSVEDTFGPEALRPAEPEGSRRRRWAARGAFSPRAKKVLELSLREALALKHNYIGTEHILLGLLREGNGLAARIIADRGLDPAALRRQTIAAIGRAA